MCWFHFIICNVLTVSMSCSIILVRCPLYYLLICSYDNSFRIVQIGGPWVDVYKLSLSMMNGGWIHFHVMDCFIQMLSCNQSFMSHLPGHLYLQFLNYAVSVSIMNKYLFQAIETILLTYSSYFCLV
jgi:hypothetical protein